MSDRLPKSGRKSKSADGSAPAPEKPGVLESVIPPPVIVTYPAFVAVSATPPDASPPPDPDSIDGKILASAKSAGLRLETATAEIVATGNEIHDILVTAKEKAETFDGSAFDAIIAKWNATFKAVNPFATFAPDAFRYWQVSQAYAAFVALGIPDPDRMAVKRYMLMFGSVFNHDKSNVSMTIRTGWAEWVKVAVPLNHTGPASMTSEVLSLSIAGQVSALHTFDPTLYPKPKAPRNTAKRRKSGGGGRKPSPPAQPPAGSGSGSATPPPAPGQPATPPPAPGSKPPVEPPAPAANVFANLVSAMTGGDAKTRVNMASAIGSAVLKSGDDDAIYALYNVIKADVHRIRESRKAEKSATKTA